MRHEVLDFTFTGTYVKTTTAPANSNALDVQRYREKTVAVQGTGWTGSLDIEGSLDGTVWHKLFTGVTANGLFVVSAAVVFMRLAVTATVAGSVGAKFGGFDSRTDGG